MTPRVVVPAGAGRAVRVREGERVRVVDVEGGQVGDVFAFVVQDPGEHLSASHTRTSTGRLFPRSTGKLPRPTTRSTTSAVWSVSRPESSRDGRGSTASFP
jgi:uncharacterized protein YcgI (DUF1989 family)